MGAREWRHLVSFYNSPGLLSEENHLFLAADLYERTRGGRGERAHRDREAPRRRPRRHDPDAEGRQDAHRAALAAELPARAQRLAAYQTLRVTAMTVALQPQGERRDAAEAGERGHHHRSAGRGPPPGAPRARLPRVPRVRARPFAQHARGLSLRPAAVRPLPGEEGAERTRCRWRRHRRLPGGARGTERPRGLARHGAPQGGLPALLLPAPAPRGHPRQRSDREPGLAAPGPAPSPGAEPRRGGLPAAAAAGHRAHRPARPSAARS